MLYYQLAAYGIVLLLWLVPIPNPVKLLAVTFHELSHGIVALLTGGRVFGLAIAPAGAGVTMGIGGNMTAILLAGYIGSCLWGAALYFVSVKCSPRHALLALLVFVFASSLLGWLNNQTMLFGLGALFVMLLLLGTPEAIQVFFVRMVGSACCLYAPLEIAGDLTNASGAPTVMGVETSSDVAQLAAIIGAPALLIMALVFTLQMITLVLLVRWTCSAGANRAIREEIAEHQMRKRLLRDVRPDDRRITIR